MLQGEKYPYEIIKHNFATLEGHEVVGVVKGESAAQSMAESYTDKLSARRTRRRLGIFHPTYDP